jgi:DNA-binding response OmpR family regulator
MSTKIMIVEDDTTLLDALAENFRDDSYTVYPCSSGKQAFDLLKEVVPNVVVTDLVMQEIDGFAVLKKFKDSAELRDIPVFILSNNASDEDIDRVMTMGAKDFIVKAETSLSEIVERVKRVL